MTSRAVIYARISADREATGMGVARQLEDCRARAAERGTPVIEEVIDNNVSAYSRGGRLRPGWERVKSLVLSEEASEIIVWHVDRLYRHPADLEEIINLVESRSLTISTVRGGDLDLNTPSGRLVARLLGSVARNEVEHKAERQARAHLALARSGGWQGGPVPLGYVRGQKRGTLIPHERDSEVMREAASRLLRGHSLKRTAMWASTELGRQLKPTTLRAALTSPTVAGRRLHIPQAHRDKWASARARRASSGDLPPNAATYPAQWEAILDLQTWTQLRALLLDPSRRSSPRRPEKSLLTSLLRCSECSGHLGYSRASYKCGESGCSRVSVSTRGIEKLILDSIEYRLEKVPVEPGPVHSKKSSESDADRTIRDLRASRRDVLKLFTSGVINSEELEQALGDLASSMSELDAQDAQAVRANERLAARKIPVDSFREVRKRIDSGDPDAIAEARAIVRALVNSVIVSPASMGKRSGPRFDHTRAAVTWIN